MHEELHIASLVVHSTPARRNRVAATISTLAGACIHAVADSGKVIVTLETSTADEMTLRVAEIQHVDGVLSAALVYQCADRLDVMNEELSDAPT
ncbi:MAG TPA: chaperone NapD [Ideonella sp.]|uniref:chaperone NapD n=1 Tax=Ideonella sp. TaxID=1929293 RepID=UPI002E304967|nr:chaperone NapD [Ideonella sp.]HEX5685329.1 chaperone NapD [Ideonella sp.]